MAATRLVSKFAAAATRSSLTAAPALRPLGDALLSNGAKLDADLFLSHCHLDHVSGLPFFTPMFTECHRIRIWAGNLLPKFNLEQALRTMMWPPLFPIEVESFKAAIEYRDFHAGEVDRACSGGVSCAPRCSIIRTARLATGSSATASPWPTSPTPNCCRAKSTAGLMSLARGADLLIFDATYTDSEIEIAARLGALDLEGRGAARRRRQSRNAMPVPPRSRS